MRHLSDPVEAVVNVWPCQRLLSALWKLNSPMCTWLELSVKPQERNGRRERETETGGLQVASRISDGTVQDRSRPRTSRQRCGRRVCLVSLWWSCRHSWIEEGWRWVADGPEWELEEYYTAAQVSVLSMSLAMRYTRCRQVKLALSCQEHVCAARWLCQCGCVCLTEMKINVLMLSWNAANTTETGQQPLSDVS